MKYKYRRVSYLEMEPESKWRHNLRNQKPGVNYVSFTLNASSGTQVEIGGAAFVIEQSQRDAAYAAIRPIGTTKRIEHETPWLLFGGARMAALDIVTVKIDRKGGTWALWFRETLVAIDLPLATQRGTPNEIFITAGRGGVWLRGFVCSDENPLFEDINDNTVPDDFEQKAIGRLLEAHVADETAAALRHAWLKERLSHPPAEFLLTAPLPDSFPDDCAPEGQFVHGMKGGMKYGAPRKN